MDRDDERPCLACRWILLAVLLYGLVKAIWVLISRWLQQPVKSKPPTQCIPIPPDIHRRPDPLIYDQYYLMSQGLAVTWDNPDISLELSGVPVSSDSLQPNTTYTVVAQIYNGSNTAGVVHMPVQFSYLSFGIATVSTFIGETFVDVPCNGAPGCPATTTMDWTTPSTPGHYCLQVQFFWGDDANPNNNLGQENTNVQPLQSPHAAFTFPVRNPMRMAQALRLEADAYVLPGQRACPSDAMAPTNVMTNEERREHQLVALARHDRRAFPVPNGWTVLIQPSELRLQPGAQQDVTVDITAPDGFTGRQTLNVNAFDGDRLAGGVTLSVTG
jgi:hypothetical protein